MSTTEKSVPEELSFTTTELKKIFGKSWESKIGNLKTAGFLAALHQENIIENDFAGFLAIGSATINAGSLNGVRILLNKDYVRRQEDGVTSHRPSILRNLVKSKSQKPNVIISIGDMLIGSGSWPAGNTAKLTEAFEKGEFSPSHNSVIINSGNKVIGALVCLVPRLNIYGFYIIRSPFRGIDRSGNTYLLHKEIMDDLSVALKQVTSIIDHHHRLVPHGRFNISTIMQYCDEEIIATYGFINDFDINSISKMAVNDRLETLSRDTNTLQSRLTSNSRNVALTKLELERLSANNSNKLDVNSIVHPLIDFAYVEETPHGANYPIIHVHTKIIPMFPDGNLEIYPEYDKNTGVPVGRFRISIDFNSGEVVKFINLTYAGGVNGYERLMQHPHVFTSGNACWGNFGETLSELISVFDIVGLIDLTMLFLQQANNEDVAGRRWPNWLETEEFPQLLEEFHTQLEEAA